MSLRNFHLKKNTPLRIGFAQKVRNATNGSWWIIKVHPTLGDAAQKLRAKRAGGKENSLGISVKE